MIYDLKYVYSPCHPIACSQAYRTTLTQQSVHELYSECIGWYSGRVRVGRVQTKVEFAQIYGIYGKLFIPVFPQSDDSDTEEYSDLRPK